MLIGGLLRTVCVRGRSPDLQVTLTRSEGGERSRRRNGIARNMLRGESCGGAGAGAGACGDGGGSDDCGSCCCCDDDDRDRAESPVAVRRMLDGRSRVITLCRRRTTTGAGEGADAAGAGADADDEDVELLLVRAGAGETGMTKAVSSSFILEEEATFRVAGRTRG